MTTADERHPARDSLVTLMAIGVLAYIGETMGHELVGHGGVCVASNGAITALAPLWMRCSVETLPMVAAGPLFNFLAATLFGVLVRLGVGSDRVRYFLWLNAAFNLLVACGYLVVGGATMFGDWSVVFRDVQPGWVWRAGAVVIGAGGYYVGLQVLARLYDCIGNRSDKGSLRRRTVLPGLAAALVAVAAEVVGGRTDFLSLALALGCTIVVGGSLQLIDNMGRPNPTIVPAPAIGLSTLWIAAALFSSAVFIAIVGPAVSLAR
jgi:hypothetical protein